MRFRSMIAAAALALAASPPLGCLAQQTVTPVPPPPLYRALGPSLWQLRDELRHIGGPVSGRVQRRQPT
jgi:hypothetical protein